MHQNAKKVIPRKNECYKLNNGKFAIIHDVQIEQRTVLSEVFPRSGNLFTSPCNSSAFGIHTVSTLNTEMQHFHFCDLKWKAIHIPLALFDQSQSATAVIVSLVHCCGY